MRRQMRRYVTVLFGLLLGGAAAVLSQPAMASAGDCLAGHKCVVGPGGGDPGDTPDDCVPTWQSSRTCHMGIDICWAGCIVLK